MIRLEHVSRVYEPRGGTVRALDDVSLTVAAGEFVAVRGPSGSGKSTLLSLVAGLDRPTSGRVEVDGHDLGAMSSAQRAAFRGESIGFVFQLFHLLPYINVLDNVLVAANNGGSARRRATELLERFGMSHRLGHHPPQLSIGERQRVAMARALLNEPRLLLADEPTGNLDAESAATVLAMLGEFHTAGGTVLLVTHEEHAADCAGRTVRIRAGRIEGEVPAAPPG